MEPLTFDEIVRLISTSVLNFALDEFLDMSDESSKRLSVSLVKTLAMAGALEEGSNILRLLKVQPSPYLDRDEEDQDTENYNKDYDSDDGAYTADRGHLRRVAREPLHMGVTY